MQAQSGVDDGAPKASGAARSAAPDRGGRVRVLRLEPALTQGLSRPTLVEAERRCLARTVHLRPCSWKVAEGLAEHDARYAIVLEGFALRRTRVAGQRFVELLGPGELLGAADQARDDASVTLRAVTPVVCAVLDRDFFRLASAWPEVGQNITAMALERAAELAHHAALLRISPLHRRVHAVLWRLGEHWGRMTPRGVRLPFPLTQADIADLVAATRPSVNLALGVLRDRGIAEEERTGCWVLRRPAAIEAAARDDDASMV
ncbi:Crp/Fnr family transcriptional regulator [Patulibacter sp. SYSU D01012]|uniref:Crp/Fnr family transcriptional regulator n=1 Tax=Patulibacter sp. SYSU D01012 TaxID=2817381 RepID=UPI001B313083